MCSAERPKIWSAMAKTTFALQLLAFVYIMESARCNESYLVRFLLVFKSDCWFKIVASCSFNWRKNRSNPSSGCCVLALNVRAKPCIKHSDLRSGFVWSALARPQHERCCSPYATISLWPCLYCLVLHSHKVSCLVVQLFIIKKKCTVLSVDCSYCGLYWLLLSMVGVVCK